MKFEQNPADNYEHGLVFEADADEVEPVAAAYRELVKLKARAGEIESIQTFERQFSMWSDTSNQTILTNRPLVIALTLEKFFERTKEAVGVIAAESTQPDFDSDEIARRMMLGEKAFQLSGLIKLEYDSDSLNKMLDQQGTQLFAHTEGAPQDTAN